MNETIERKWRDILLFSISFKSLVILLICSTQKGASASAANCLLLRKWDHEMLLWREEEAYMLSSAPRREVI